MTTTVYNIQFDPDYSTWKKYFLLVNKPNLLQSWSYGQAKTKSQKWKITRGVIYENDKPIALIQIWYKPFLFMKVARLNQGPLWLIEQPTAEQITHVFRIIKKRWSLIKRSILFIAPNIENIPSLKEILSSLRFYKRRCDNVNSGLIDLRQSESELRAGLRGNWRRRLKTSEKNALSFVTSQDPTDFEWLISHYADYQKTRSFEGTPVPLLSALYQCATDFHEVWIAFATHENERIAGMLVAYYGSACTPLVSWLSDKGRELNAGNFILWNFILFSKEKGCRWFEQGGIDEKNNADVARFKRGLPCDEYELIGEYIVGI